jgi:hypothetical protein
MPPAKFRKIDPQFRQVRGRRPSGLIGTKESGLGFRAARRRASLRDAYWRCGPFEPNRS